MSNIYIENAPQFVIIYPYAAYIPTTTTTTTIAYELSFTYLTLL